MGDREPFRERAEVRPRFRCLVCKRFVVGTEHGTCPQCGWKPPTLTPGAPTRHVDPWPIIIIALCAIAAVLGWVLK